YVNTMARPRHSRRRKPAESRAETKAETRDALIDAAATLFGRDGLDAPSLDDICAKAGYTRGAFYVHFKSREELIVAVVERHSRRALDAIVGAGDEVDLAAVVRRFTDAVATGRYPRGGAVKLHHFLDACARSASGSRRPSTARARASPPPRARRNPPAPCAPTSPPTTSPSSS